MLTACGIETPVAPHHYELHVVVATVLTACGIETNHKLAKAISDVSWVATVLTACGIETFRSY